MIRSDNILLKTRPRNFAESIRQCELGLPAYIVNGDFLDAFYHAEQSDRQSFLDVEPPHSNIISLTNSELANYAAMAEKLAHDYDLITPRWTNKARYFLAVETFLGKPASTFKKQFIEIMRDETPPEFLHRNILVSDNVLTRM